MKKVSLILTTFNSKDNLKKTLRSIEIQDYPNIEVVIKDGGSTDGTLDIIREYQEKSKLIIVTVSKCDTGIYDAMNQGYELSSGDVIVCFNDVFAAPDVVSKMVKKMETINPDTGKGYVGVHADLVYVDGEKVVRNWCMGEGCIYLGWMPGHPTLFLKREIYEKYGLYRTDFKIAADYEFMVRFLKDKENEITYLPETIIKMFYGGTSTVGLKSYIESFMEGYRALKINKIGFAFWITCFRTLRVLIQFKE